MSVRTMPLAAKTLLVLALAAITWPSQAQVKVTGRVVDAEGAAVSLANVQLLARADSLLVQGSIAGEDGTFVLRAIRPGAYLLHVSLIGYEDHLSRTLELSEDGNRDVGRVMLRQKVLEIDGVSVEARRVFYEQQGDRLIINVGGSATLSGKTALEVLERSPGVVVDEQSSTVSLVGKDGVRVMVDGKRSYVPADGLVQYLSGISAENVERIELITSPPANLDAEGNAGFINIVLKRNPTRGVSGSAMASGGYGEGAVGNASANVNYQHGRVGVYASYSGLLFGQRQHIANYRRVRAGGDVLETPTSTHRDPLRINHDARLALDYEIDGRTTVGGLMGAYDHKWSMDALNRMMLRSGGVPMTRIVSDNDEVNHWRHAMSNVHVQRELRGGASLRADVDYVYYHNDNPTNYVNTTTDLGSGHVARERLESGKITPLRMWVAKVDYQTRWREKWKLAAGVKGAFSRFTNEASYEGLVKEEWLSGAGLASRSTLRENVLATYGSAAVQLSTAAALKMGLRYEHTDSQLDSDEERGLVDRRFGSLFPSLAYSHKLGEVRQVDLSYTRRITRPSFSDIAPFLYFIDPFTFFAGNTALQPAIMNTVKLGFTSGDLLTSVEYAWEDSTISQFQSRILPEENVQLIFTQNMRQSRRVAALVALPVHPASWWSTQNNVMATWREISGFRDGAAVTFGRTSLRLNSVHNISLPYDFAFEVSGFYQSPTQLGLMRMDPLWGVDMGLQRVLPGGFGKLTLSVNDVFDSVEMSFAEGSPQDRVYTEAVGDFSQRSVQLTYSFRFGDGKASGTRSTASMEERERVE